MHELRNITDQVLRRRRVRQQIVRAGFALTIGGTVLASAGVPNAVWWSVTIAGLCVLALAATASALAPARPPHGRRRRP